MDRLRLRARNAGAEMSLSGHELTVHRCMLAAIVIEHIRQPDFDLRDCDDREWEDQVQMLRILCDAYVGLLAEAGWKPRMKGRFPVGSSAMPVPR